MPNGNLQKHQHGIDMQGKFDFDDIGKALFDMDKYPHKAGHRGVRTSKQSADEINPKLSRLQKMVLIELEKVYPDGLNTSELANRTKKNLLTIRPRTTELKLLGAIIDTETTRKNDGGKAEIVYKLRSKDILKLIDYYGIKEFNKK